MVQDRFQEMLPGQKSAEDDEGAQLDRADLFKVVIERWLNDVEPPGSENDIGEMHDKHGEELGELDSDDELEQPFHKHREAITKSPAYEWLISTLQAEASLHHTKPNVVQDIREKILAAFPSHRVSRSKASQEFWASFRLDWDPLAFIKEQEYVGSIDELVEGAITLTGEANNSQASTVSQYMSQTWPSTGLHVLDLVKRVLEGPHEIHDSVLPDGTELAANIIGRAFKVTAIGVSEALTEVAQQFAWLGAALRSSLSEREVTLCTPTIGTIHRCEIPAGILQKVPILTSAIDCEINFRLHDPLPNGQVISGQCWRNMFRNPVLVQGFPVLARHEQGFGLELPLEMIGALVNTDHVTTFEDQIFVKGFSAMLVATKMTHDLMIWHYVYRERGQDGECQRVSYLDHGVKSDDLALWQVRSSRHVVGWCSNASHLTGMWESPLRLFRNLTASRCSRCFI